MANPSIELDLSSRRVIDVDFRMIIITYNIPWSLHRLLLSLNTVDYMSDKVTVEIWIDRSKEGRIHEQTYAVGHKFVFEKGSKTVINQTRHVGLYGQWMGLWQPTEETKEIAVIFEDDLTVSPFFYRYLKNAHAKYGSVPYLNSYALQCSMKHNGKEGNLHAPDSNPVFLYPILGTCGFSPQKRNWIEFREWYIEASKDPHFHPLVPGIKPTDWYNDHIRFKATDNMWEMWHIYHAYKNKYYTLYPNLLRFEGMKINWKEHGSHVGDNVNVTDRLLSKWNSR